VALAPTISGSVCLRVLWCKTCPQSPCNDRCLLRFAERDQRARLALKQRTACAAVIVTLRVSRPLLYTLGALAKCQERRSHHIVTVK